MMPQGRALSVHKLGVSRDIQGLQMQTPDEILIGRLASGLQETSRFANACRIVSADNAKTATQFTRCTAGGIHLPSSNTWSGQ